MTNPGADITRPIDAHVKEVLVENHREFLRFLERRLGRRDLAEDILQDAFARGLDKLESLRDGEAAVPWFYRTLRNATIDYYRRTKSAHRALAQFAEEMETDVRVLRANALELPEAAPADGDLLGGALLEIRGKRRELRLAHRPLRVVVGEHAAHDLEEPRSRSRRIANGFSVFGGADERLLKDVLGVRARAKTRTQKGEDALPVRHQLADDGTCLVGYAVKSGLCRRTVAHASASVPRGDHDATSPALRGRAAARARAGARRPAGTGRPAAALARLRWVVRRTGAVQARTVLATTALVRCVAHGFGLLAREDR